MLITSLAGCINDNKFRGKQVEYTKYLTFITQTQDVEELRYAASAVREDNVENMYVFYFNKATGKKEVGEFIPKNKLEEVSQGKYKVTIQNIPPGEKLVVAIANIRTKSDDATIQRLEIWPEVLDNIKTLEELQKLSAKMSTNQMFFLEGREMLLLSTEPTPVTIYKDNTTIENAIPLIRSAAKIEVQVKIGGLTKKFMAESWQVLHMPNGTAILPDKERSTQATNDKYNKYYKDNMLEENEPKENEDYFTTKEFPLEKDGTTFSFYMYESILQPRLRIQLDGDLNKPDPLSKAAAKRFAFNNRSARKKIRADGKIGVNDVYHVESTYDNGMFENAPVMAPSLVIRGTYEGSSRFDQKESAQAMGWVTYTIPLGFVGEKDETISDTDFVKKVNDYTIKRNTHYKYTITILGLREVIAEAEHKGGKYDETTPSTEGYVVESKARTIDFDCHYDSRRFPIKNMQEMRDADIPEDPKDVTIIVRTPYGDKIFPYNELKSGPNSALYKRLVNWVQFYVPQPQWSGGWNNYWWFWAGMKEDVQRWPSHIQDRYRLNIKGNPDGSDASLKKVIEQRVWNLETFIERLCLNKKWVSKGQHDSYDNNIESFFNRNQSYLTGEMNVTVFVDEYYYYTNPINGLPAKWKDFVNNKWREIIVLSKGQHSSDGNSHYFEYPMFTIRQRPIYTPFGMGSNGEEIAFGVESINETGECHSEPLEFPGLIDLVSDLFFGHRNTIRYLEFFTSGKSGKAADRYSGDSYSNYKFWYHLYATGTTTQGGNLKYHDRFKPRYKTNPYLACLTRNRDLNNNGVIDKEEIRWVLPSSEQLKALALGQDAFSQEARLFPVYQDPEYKAYYNYKNYKLDGAFYMSSTRGNVPIMFSIANDKKYYGQYFLWSYEGISIGANHHIVSNGAGYLRGNQEEGFNLRCVRILGGAEENLQNADKDRFIEFTSPVELIKPGNEPDYIETTVALRSRRVGDEFIATGEQGQHKFFDRTNLPFKAFYVAKYAIGGELGNNVERVMGKHAYSFPCKDYKETYGNKTYTGWRTPNADEMQLIREYYYNQSTENFFRCDTKDKNGNIKTNVAIPAWLTATWGVDAMMNYNNTIIAFLKQGEAVHVFQAKSSWSGRDPNDNDIYGPGFFNNPGSCYIRCVKDRDK